MSDTNDKTPREYTAEETRDMLIKKVHSLVDYWHKETRVTDTLSKARADWQTTMTACKTLLAKREHSPKKVRGPKP